MHEMQDINVFHEAVSPYHVPIISLKGIFFFCTVHLQFYKYVQRLWTCAYVMESQLRLACASLVPLAIRRNKSSSCASWIPPPPKSGLTLLIYFLREPRCPHKSIGIKSIKHSIKKVNSMAYGQEIHVRIQEFTVRRVLNWD